MEFEVKKSGEHYSNVSQDSVPTTGVFYQATHPHTGAKINGTALEIIEWARFNNLAFDPNDGCTFCRPTEFRINRHDAVQLTQREIEIFEGQCRWADVDSEYIRRSRGLPPSHIDRIDDVDLFPGEGAKILRSRGAT